MNITKMQNIIQNYDLFIFDLDDTLVKTEDIHYNAWVNTIKHFLNKDFHIDRNTFLSIFHSKIPNSITNYLNKLFNINDCSKIIEFKNNKYFEMINDQKNNIKMIDGVHKFIENIIINNKKFVIVTNGLKCHVNFFSELFPILKNSSKNYYREMFKNKKPDPECFQRVIDDFPNTRKICFEDSITGIHAVTQLPEITVYYVNSSEYFYHDYIVNNYNITHINNFEE